MTTPDRDTPAPVAWPRARLAVMVPVFGAALVWAEWPELREMAASWTHDARYSHGVLVPAFAGYLLWHRRDRLTGFGAPSAWGAALVAAGAALKLVGARYYVSWFDALSLLPMLAGLALLVGGWPVLRWSAASVAFLIFMIPLPYRVEMALGYPLQRLATVASNYALQTLGLPSVAEGNIILLDGATIGVVEACNGLGMLFMFFAFTVATAMVTRRPLLDRVILVASAVPIALAANVLRITVTGLLHEAVGGKVANAVYHDLAGWLMMPVALAAMAAELSLLSRLFLDAPPQPPLPLLAAPALRAAGAAPPGA